MFGRNEKKCFAKVMAAVAHHDCGVTRKHLSTKENHRFLQLEPCSQHGFRQTYVLYELHLIWPFSDNINGKLKIWHKHHTSCFVQVVLKGKRCHTHHNIQQQRLFICNSSIRPLPSFRETLCTVNIYRYFAPEIKRL